MKITLEGCKHRAIESWGDGDVYAAYATCLNCYERFVIHAPTNHRQMRFEPAPPPPIRCPHRHRKPVAAQVTKNMPYRDAICTECGVIQRHPDGRGAWTDVQFYGYLIKEESWF